MQQKILEIIEFLISEVNNYQDLHLSDIDTISERLLDRGYTEIDIQSAVEWIVEFMSSPDTSEISRSMREATYKNIRLLSEFERAFFTKEAHGYFMQLQLLGLVTPVQVEQIIDRSMMSGLEKVKLEEIQDISIQIMNGVDSKHKKSGHLKTGIP